MKRYNIAADIGLVIEAKSLEDAKKIFFQDVLADFIIHDFDIERID